MKKIILLSLITITSINILSKDIKGTIIESTNSTPIEFANVILYTIDSCFVNGTLSDENGKFIIPNIENDKYIIKFSALGYSPISKNIDTSIEFITNIKLETDVLELSEITVLGKKKIIEKKARGLIANVGTSSLRNLNTSIDVLKRLPSVFIDKDNLSVLGKGEPVIYVNNRKLYSIDDLSNIHPENISTVEILLNPGVEYDANGKAVILIKTKQILEGLSILISSEWVQRKYGESNDFLSINYTKNKFSYYLNYNYKHIKRFSEEYRNDFSTYKDIHQNYTRSADYEYSRQLNILTLGTDWNITPTQILGAQYQGSFNKANSDMVTQSNLFLNDNLGEASNSKNAIDDTPTQNIGYIYHSGEWTDQYKTNINIQYLNNRYKRKQYVLEEQDHKSNSFNTLNKNKYDIYSIKQSNTITLDDRNSITLGGDFNHISSKNKLYSLQSQVKEEDYKNKETRIAGFLNYTTKIHQIDLELGIRYEHEKLVSDSSSIRIINRTTNNIFPNISLSTEINGWSLSLVGSAATQRPSFAQLNGNFIYLNKYTLQKGNPSLKNIKMYEVGLEAQYKNIFSYLGYRYDKNPIGFSVLQSFENYIYSSYLRENFSKAHEITLALNYSNKIGFWQPNYIVQLIQPFFKSIFMEGTKKYNKMSCQMNLFNDFSYKNYTFSANIYYRSPSYSELTYKTTSTSIAFEFGVQTSFLKDKLNVNFATYDPFNMTKKQKFVRSVHNSILSGEDVNRLGYVSLSLSYKFNNYANKSKKLDSSDFDRL